ncbi:MAG TPA: hypothetical protein VH969_22940 [Actinophytocola sp.]|uniref:hypothetical protein n=1 Tax=Actinophytocola sp. TaxID=1872138 RepID=UPI002F950FB7
MANTRNLTTAVVDHVRDVLSAQYQTVFHNRRMRLQPGGYHEFEAVSDNGRIVASVKTAAGNGRHPAGTISNCLAALYFLSLVRAHRKILVLTSPEFHAMFMIAMDGKIPHGVEIMHVPLPADVQARVAAVQQAGTDETQPALDAEELRAVGGH